MSQWPDLTDDLSFSLHRKLKKELTTDVGYRDLTTLSLNTNSCRDSKRGWILNRNKAEVLGTASNTGQVHPELLTKALLSQAQSKGAELILGCVQGVEFDEDGGVVGVKVFKNYPGILTHKIFQKKSLSTYNIHCRTKQSTED